MVFAVRRVGSAQMGLRDEMTLGPTVTTADLHNARTVMVRAATAAAPGGPQHPNEEAS